MAALWPIDRPAGMGIRLDAGTAFSGAVVTPYYDSLLVKVTARGRRFKDAATRMERCLQEFRVRGVKTNLPFLINLVTHPTFLAGECTTTFIDDTPELFHMPVRRDRASKLLQFLGETIVNGNPLVKDRPKSTRREPAPVPAFDRDATAAAGHAAKVHRTGAGEIQQMDSRSEAAAADRHDAARCASVAVGHADAHARHAGSGRRLRACWCRSCFRWKCGGARRSTRRCGFSRNAPGSGWPICASAIPNILFQMLLRASNAVGYTNYPDNVVQAFVEESVQAGMDIFRIFDPLNWTENMRVAMDAVHNHGGICEAAICYTGDILNPKRPKYSLKYYVDLAKELERMGAHILAIKDMAGLCKPYAAELLVKTLKQEIGIPIHFHTHDTSGVSAAAVLKAAEVGSGYCRWRAGADVGADLAAEFEFDRRGAAIARRAIRASMPNSCGSSHTTGKRCANSTRRSKAT